MRYSRSRSHALNVSRTNHRAIANTVLVLERAVDDVGNDFHVAMGMGWEPFAGTHAVIVDHAQRSDPHLGRVVVVPKRKAMPAVEPAVLSVAPVLTTANCDDGCILPFGNLRTWKRQTIQTIMTSLFEKNAQ